MDKRFIKGVEKLINPVTVGSLHFIQFFNSLMPKKIQKLFINSSSKNIPYMGFVVEPYSFFACYEIADINAAKKLLPDNFKLVKTRIFDDDDPKYYGIFGCFRSHTSAFWGTRVELYIIAEDQSSGLLSWVIVDYDTDTISYDNGSGLRAPNSTAVLATDYSGHLVADIYRKDKSRRLAFDADLNNLRPKKLDQRLWLEGNLSIGYGKVLSDNEPYVFSLTFDPKEVETASNVPISDVDFEENSWYPCLFADKPSKLVCFPYAQHFVSDSPGISSRLKDKSELEKAQASVDFGKAKTMSAKLFQTMFLIGATVSFLLTLSLLILLILK